MLKYFYSFICVTIAVLFCGCVKPKTDAIDLSGAWQVSLGSSEAQSQSITLPGTIDIAGIGIADTLQPRLEETQISYHTRCRSFVGEAFYSRVFEVPEDLAGKPLELILERVFWKSIVSIDGQLLQALDGTDMSLVGPHRYTLPHGLLAGRHDIRIFVDNRRQCEIPAENYRQSDIPADEPSLSCNDSTQVKWNGILGRMELRALPEVSIDRVEVYPNETLRKLDVLVQITNHTSELQETFMALLTSPKGESEIWYSNPSQEILEPGTSVISLSCNLPSHAPHWSALHPDLLNVTVSIETRLGIEEKNVVTGLRHLGTRDGKLLVNGETVSLRGTLECCLFPLSGCSPTDKAGWQAVFDEAKEWGINHLRFHSLCPPEAAFEVADSMGFYLGVELPVWAMNLGSDSIACDFLRQEYENVIRSYGNHPSFCLLGVDYELQSDSVFLNDFINEMKVRDPRHLYTTTSYTFEKEHGRHPEPRDQYLETDFIHRCRKCETK